MSKKTIVKLALGYMEKEGAAKLTLEDIGNMAGVPFENMIRYFPHGNHELLMDAVELAGHSWVSHIRQEVNEVHEIEKKIKLLACRYALGTVSFPTALSVYIDLWQMVKNGNEPYVRERLKHLYQYYTEEFCAIAGESGLSSSYKPEKRAFALLMTVLSDVLHIQSVVLGDEIDMISMQHIIEAITECILVGGGYA